MLSVLPGLKTFLSSNSKERVHNELLFVVTPHVVRKPFRGTYVASMDEDEMRKVFRIRAVLESIACD